MIYTFAMVLVFTMLKELYEDIFRMKGDREVNNKKSMVYDRESQEFKVTSWGKLRLGDIVKV